VLQTPAITRYQSSYSACPPARSSPVLGGGVRGSWRHGDRDQRRPARLPAQLRLRRRAAPWRRSAPLATTAPSLRLRDRAVARLVAQLVPPYAPIDPVDAPTWQAFFRDRYTTTTSLSRLFTVWRGSQRLRDADALPLLADRLRAVPMPVVYQVDFVCQAFDLAAPGDWAAFKDVLQPWSTLPAEVAAVLTDPGQCANRRMAPAPDADADADADAAFDRSRWLRRAHAR
jgi:hypothetical protein